MRRVHTLALAGAFAAILVTSGAIPAYASGTATASCRATQEVCRVTHSNVTTHSVRIKTSFPGVSGSAHYDVRAVQSGAILCSGTMSYNTTFTCNTGVIGQVVFAFYKGQNPVGTISATG